MTYDKVKYSKAVIEIADFIFKNPDKKMSDVLSYFVIKCRKNRRTIERYLQNAKKYNKTRLNLKEKAKNGVLVRQAQSEAQNAIISRDEILQKLKQKLSQLDAIITGSGYMAKDKLTGNPMGFVQATYSDEIRAVQAYNQIAKQIADMEGYNAAIKVASTDSRGNDVIDTVNVNIRKQ
jgi:flagellar biosynthesis chaperone FliJ